jgi:tetratricopeptide (TPR) repeat protein
MDRARLIQQVLQYQANLSLLYWSKSKHRFVRQTITPQVLSGGVLTGTDLEQKTKWSFKVTSIRELTLLSDPPQTVRPSVQDKSDGIRRWGMLVVVGLLVFVIAAARYVSRRDYSEQTTSNGSETPAPVRHRTGPPPVVTAPPSNPVPNAVFWPGESLWLDDTVRGRLLADGRVVEDKHPPQSFEPNTSRAYYTRGQGALEKGYLNNALADFTRAIILDPYFVEAYKELASTHMLKGEYDKAIEDCNRAIFIKSYWPPAYCVRAAARLSTHDFAGALIDFTKTIELDPDNGLAHNGRAWLYYKQGRYAESIADADKAISLTPNECHPYDTRGWAKFRSGDTDGAITDCQQAAKLCPKSSSGHCSQGLVDYLAKRYDSAVREWTAASELSPLLNEDLAPWITKARARKGN